MAMNEYMHRGGSEDAPYVGCVALAGGAQTLTQTGRGLHITTAGNITFTMQDGSTMTLTAIPAGVYRHTVRAISVCTAAGYVLF